MNALFYKLRDWHPYGTVSAEINDSHILWAFVNRDENRVVYIQFYNGSPACLLTIKRKEMRKLRIKPERTGEVCAGCGKELSEYSLFVGACSCGHRNAKQHICEKQCTNEEKYDGICDCYNTGLVKLSK